MPYAHTAPPPHTLDDWAPYEMHAAQVASLAESFARSFDAGDWGRLAGAWHDFGKLQPDFQRYLRGQITDGPPRVDGRDARRRAGRERVASTSRSTRCRLTARPFTGA